MSDKRKDVNLLLLEAIEKTTAGERAAYIDEVCRDDPELRAELESLLKAHEQAGSFLDVPMLGSDVTLDTSPVSESPGAIIDKYKLLEKIGEGGMAVVYMAEQERPVRRKVALKIIKLGMDTKSVIARFEAERQALAIMDHPNIAKVFDGGATNTGRPYFVMELVRGIAITEYSDKCRLNTRQRLELFVQVCNAVQHAHQKGIIHRDIKPSNVLVTLRDGTPVPKVIDFGIAKATNQHLTEKTLFTRFAQMIGTPEYMSPEQAGMSELDVDTRTDVYSLGVLLYELLTGSTPFDPSQLREAGYAGIQRIIRETEPPRPSTKLSTLGRTLTDVAQLRQTNPEMLSRLIRGDLDWIAMKTLDKDRTRRYETAHALAEDIGRHLRDEPISAGRPSMLHRFRKFVRRNRSLVTGAAAVLIVLLLGVAGIAVFAYREQQQARTAQAIVDFLNRDLLGSVSPDQAGSPQVTVHSILDAASARLEGKFHDEPLVEASIRQTLGQMYIELGDYKLAEPHLRRAYEVRRKQLGDKAPLTLTSMSVLGRVCYLQGRFAEAEPLLAQAFESRRLVLGAGHRDTVESSVWLAVNYLYPGEPDHMDEAERLLSSALESGRRASGKKDATTLEAMCGLAFLKGMIWGQMDEAASLCLEGCEAAKRELGEKHRLTLQFMTMSAWMLTSPDLHEEVQARVRTAIETYQRILGKEHPDTLIAMSTLGMVYARQDELEKAESLLTESLPLLRKSLGEGHGYTLFFTRCLGDMYLSQGRYKEAEQLFTKLIDDGRRSLGNDHLILLTTRFSMTKLYAMQERPDELKAWCLRELEKVRGAPDDTGLAAATILGGLAWVEATYSSSVVRSGAEAVRHATQACELSDWKSSITIDTLAAAYAETSDFANAIRWQKKALEVFAQESHPSMLDLSAAVYRLGLYQSGRPARMGLWLDDPHSLLGRKKYEEAERKWTNELAVIRRYLGESHPETRGCILSLIELYENWGKPQDAQRYREMLPPELEQK